MKKITKLTCTFAVMAAALFALTGCSNPDPSAETSKPAVAYVISNTANSKPVDSSAPLIQDTMLDATMNYGYSFIVRVDGDPALVSAEDLNIDEQYKTASKERLKRDAASKASNLLQIVDGVPFKSRGRLSGGYPPQRLLTAEPGFQLHFPHHHLLWKRTVYIRLLKLPEQSTVC